MKHRTRTLAGSSLPHESRPWEPLSRGFSVPHSNRTLIDLDAFLHHSQGHERFCIHERI